MFQYIEVVLKRLRIDPEVSFTPGMTQILVDIMTEIMSVFAVATKEVNKGPLSESILTGESPSNVALAALFRELCKESQGRKRHG